MVQKSLWQHTPIWIRQGSIVVWKIYTPSSKVLSKRHRFNTILKSAVYMQWWPLTKVTILLSQQYVLAHLSKKKCFYYVGWAMRISALAVYSQQKKLHSCAHVKYFWCLSFVYIDLLNPRTVIFFEVVKKSKDTIWISWSALLGALRHNCFWILSNCALPASTVSLHLHNAVLLPLKCKH